MAERRKKTRIGFGFDPTESAHHFVLTVSEDGGGAVVIEERYAFGETTELQRPEPRARIDGYTWSRVEPCSIGRPGPIQPSA
jgi:hypothetical protein